MKQLRDSSSEEGCFVILTSYTLDLQPDTHDIPGTFCHIANVLYFVFLNLKGHLPLWMA